MAASTCAKMIAEKYDSDMPLNGYGTNVKIKPFHIQYYLEKGGRLIDTAQTYGNAKVIGMGLNLSKKPRSKLFLATKVGPEQFDDTYSAIVKHLKEFEGYPKGSLTNFLMTYNGFPMDVFRNSNGHAQQFLETL